MFSATIVGKIKSHSYRGATFIMKLKNFSKFVLLLILGLFVVTCGRNTTENTHESNTSELLNHIVGSKDLAQVPGLLDSLLLQNFVVNDDLDEVFAHALPGDREIRIEYFYFDHPLITDVRIQRKLGSPVSGIDDGTMVYFGPPDDRGVFTDTGLTNGNVYYYRIWTYSQILNDYSQSGTSVSAVPQALYSQPIPEAESVSFIPGDGQVTIDFDVPNDPRVLWVRILRKTTNDISGPFDSSAEFVFRGSSGPIVDSGLTNGTTYYYKIYVRGLRGQHSPNGIDGVATPNGSIVAPSPVNDLTVMPGDMRNTLSWNAPSDSLIDSYRVIRKTTNNISGPDDPALNVVIAYEGTQSSFVDLSLVNGTTYYYGVFAFNVNSNTYSTGVFGQGTPNGAFTSGDQTEYLKPNQIESGDYLGQYMAIDGDTLVVSARGDDGDANSTATNPNNNAPDSGAVYVFRRIGNTWTQEAYLKASNAGSNDWFGSAVSLEENTLAIGAAGENGDINSTATNPNDNANSAGAVYIFEKQGSTWNQTHYIKSFNAYLVDYFGSDVILKDNSLFVTAPWEDGDVNSSIANPNRDAFGAGAVYVYKKQGNNWNIAQYLKSNHIQTGDNFGSDIALNGAKLVIGARMEDGDANSTATNPNDNVLDSGAAYVYERIGENWFQSAYLKASNPSVGDKFGESVDISNDDIVVGVQLEKGDANSTATNPNDLLRYAGAAYIFHYDSGWVQQHYLKANDVDQDDFFGIAVAVNDTSVFVGSSGEDGDTNSTLSNPNDNSLSTGVVHIFGL